MSSPTGTQMQNPIVFVHKSQVMLPGSLSNPAVQLLRSLSHSSWHRNIAWRPHGTLG